MKPAIRLTLATAFAVFYTFALAAPETYVIDGTHTFPRFSYSHFGYSKQLSRFDNTTGTIVLDKEAKTASVDITVDMKSVSTGSTLFNEHIQGADFFDTARYPTATFKSSNVTFDGDKPITVAGNLTIKGVTQPVTLNIESFLLKPNPIFKKDVLGANATASIKRTNFNMGKYTPAISDDITLDIALEAVKQ
jgi:polyisoprenoid-binding protein YceI